MKNQDIEEKGRDTGIPQPGQQKEEGQGMPEREENLQENEDQDLDQLDEDDASADDEENLDVEDLNEKNINMRSEPVKHSSEIPVAEEQ